MRMSAVTSMLRAYRKHKLGCHNHLLKTVRSDYMVQQLNGSIDNEKPGENVIKSYQRDRLNIEHKVHIVDLLGQGDQWFQGFCR